MAKNFHSNEKFDGELLTPGYAHMRFLVKYNYFIKIGTNPVGLFLSPKLLFRLNHSDLFIPWNDILVKQKNETVFGYPYPWKTIRLYFRDSEDVFFEITENFAKKVHLLDYAKATNDFLPEDSLKTTFIWLAWIISIVCLLFYSIIYFVPFIQIHFK